MKIQVLKDRIILPKTTKKGTIIKVYFTRDKELECTKTDYPIATHRVDRITTLDWFKDFTILRIDIKKPNTLFIFKHNWECVYHIW